MVQCLTGLRPSELLGLREQDVLRPTAACPKFVLRLGVAAVQKSDVSKLHLFIGAVIQWWLVCFSNCCTKRSLKAICSMFRTLDIVDFWPERRRLDEGQDLRRYLFELANDGCAADAVISAEGPGTLGVEAAGVGERVDAGQRSGTAGVRTQNWSRWRKRIRSWNHEASQVVVLAEKDA